MLEKSLSNTEGTLAERTPGTPCTHRSHVCPDHWVSLSPYQGQRARRALGISLSSVLGSRFCAWRKRAWHPHWHRGGHGTHSDQDRRLALRSLVWLCLCSGGLCVEGLHLPWSAETHRNLPLPWKVHPPSPHHHALVFLSSVPPMAHQFCTCFPRGGRSSGCSQQAWPGPSPSSQQLCLL